MSFLVAMHSDYNFTCIGFNTTGFFQGNVSPEKCDNNKKRERERERERKKKREDFFMSDNTHEAYLLISKRNLSALAMFSISEAYSDNIKDSSAVGTNLSSWKKKKERQD